MTLLDRVNASISNFDIDTVTELLYDIGEELASEKLKPHGLYAIPNDEEELVAYIKHFPVEQRSALFTVMGMTWNLACKRVNSES